MKQFGEVKPSLEEIEHSGVKGMHWGVRKARQLNSEAKYRQRTAPRGRRLDQALIQATVHNGRQAVGVILGSIGVIAVSAILANRQALRGL